MDNALTIENIVGLPLSIVRYAADMLVLHFGEISKDEDGSQSWGEYAVHIQSAWRITQANSILTGKFDHRSSSDKLSREDGEFMFWELSVVLSAKINQFGDLQIKFGNDFTLRTFSCRTDGEFWRLLQPDVNSQHHVVPSE